MQSPLLMYNACTYYYDHAPYYYYYYYHAGKVYNITPYMKFHPGGVDDLVKAAGIDCTILFDEVYR